MSTNRGEVGAPSPVPGPPPPVPEPADADVEESEGDVELDDAFAALVPDADRLEELPVKEHVAIFEELQSRLADEMDDSDE